MEPSLKRSIAERAEQQLSLITEQQLGEIGVDARRRRRLVQSGLLDLVGLRTFRVPGAPQSFRTRVMGACLDLNGVASHRSSAHLHSLAGFERPPSMVEITILEGHGRTRSSLARVHRTSNLGADDLVTIDGVPSMNVARTLLGLAALVPEIHAEQIHDAVDAAVRDGKASDRWLWWRLEQLRCRGRKGVAVMEEVLQRRVLNGSTESWLEREFLSLIARAGLPSPVVQQVVRVEGAFAARVDCLFERQRVVVELNGHATHSTKRQRDADAARANRLQLLGYRVLVFTYDDVVQRPHAVVATVAEALTPPRPYQHDRFFVPCRPHSGPPGTKKPPSSPHAILRAPATRKRSS